VTVAEPEHIVVLVTTRGEEEAQRIAKQLLVARLAACVNIVNGMRSFFHWQDKQETEQESLLIIKSSGRLLSRIVEAVKKTHSYDVPEIIALPVIGGNEDYLGWIDSEVRQ
jgi:periplasmic divalent cation tolerance protein